ncbi:hypothetical protein EGW08_003319 [Elysia chlorotica]|uniref:ADAMTS cysteine-rich domain-containing protein n=1 Tax=Elysia chlorotica TaxID=188477 RepID=A0A433U520_ELYCH|nr:hypothetical protein EGW08_003319 [Elysia chlorotica]
MNAISTIPIPSSARGNPWRFSTCSISSIKTYLGSVSCTEPGNTGSTDALPYPTGDDRAGIAKDRDDQCQQIGYTGYCSAAQDQNGGESNLCSGMFCTDPNDADAAECIAIIPLEYSSCGADMWCRLGNCMNNNEEPTNPPPATNQPPSPPRTIFDCLPFLLKLDFLGLIFCIRLGNCMNNNEEPTNPPPATNQPPSPPRTIFDCLPFLLKLDFLGLIFCISCRISPSRPRLLGRLPLSPARQKINIPITGNRPSHFWDPSKRAGQTQYCGCTCGGNLVFLQYLTTDRRMGRVAM